MFKTVASVLLIPLVHDNIVTLVVRSSFFFFLQCCLVNLLLVLINVEKKVTLRLKMEIGRVLYKNYHHCQICRFEVILDNSGQNLSFGRKKKFKAWVIQIIVSLSSLHLNVYTAVQDILSCICKLTNLRGKVVNRKIFLFFTIIRDL